MSCTAPTQAILFKCMSPPCCGELALCCSFSDCSAASYSDVHWLIPSAYKMCPELRTWWILMVASTVRLGSSQVRKGVTSDQPLCSTLLFSPIRLGSSQVRKAVTSDQPLCSMLLLWAYAQGMVSLRPTVSSL